MPTPPDKPVLIRLNGSASNPSISICTVGLLAKVFLTYTSALVITLAATLNYVILPRIAEAQSTTQKTAVKMARMEQSQYIQQVKLDMLLARLQVVIPDSIKAEAFRPDAGNGDGGRQD